MIGIVRQKQGRWMAVGLMIGLSFGSRSHGQNEPAGPNSVPAVSLPAPPSEAEDELSQALVPSQAVYPIDLPGALRLAGARDLDIAIARTRVARAAADLDRARALWLPSLFIGPNWIRHDGQAQIVEGPVRTISKSSLFFGATAAAGSSVSGPVPAGGPAQVSGLTTVLRFSDAIFEPLAALQVRRAREAGVAAASNDALLEAAEAYLDLQDAAGRLAIAKEAVANARMLSEITGSYARTGAGLEADHQRSLAELDVRGRDVVRAVGSFEVASAELVRRLRIDPSVVVAPVEPAESVLRLVNDEMPIDELIVLGLRNRPELAEARSIVEATLVRLKQARLRPFIPSLALRYSGGGFGGGVNNDFGDFASRSDADVNLYWEVANLGITDRAIQRMRKAEREEAGLRVLQEQDRVAAEVVQAEKQRLAATREMRQTAKAVPEAIRSLELNFTSIRRGGATPGAVRPLEVLQPIQALATAREAYLEAVLAYNRAQFRLYHAMGRPPVLERAPATMTGPVARPEAIEIPPPRPPQGAGPFATEPGR